MQNSTAYLQVEVDYRRQQLRRSWRPLLGRRSRVRNRVRRDADAA
jgi:hypothetical protein